jgi:mediator of replication checkpoint protein 1
MDVVHDGPTPSTDDQNDEGTDKENDTNLMFDRSDDKENKAVVRFGLSGLRRDDTLDLDLSEPRRPFQELPSPDTPKAFQLGRANLTEMFEAQLSESRRTPDLSPGPLLQPFMEGKSAGGFSQFSDDEGTLLGKTPSNGDLADLFDVTTQKLGTKSWSPKGGLAEAFIEQVSAHSRFLFPGLIVLLAAVRTQRLS